jgi:aminoglycoside phosphotransferase (APT) family kinase protein
VSDATNPPCASTPVGSPASEIDVTERMVRALLLEQHPDLVELSLERLDEGWDNTLWRLGSELVVRLPRRGVAAPLVVNEQRWLPTLAALLPLPVSSPVRVGRPSAEYPWSWSVLPWLEGTPGDRAELTDPDDAAIRLASFLRALHRPAPSGAPRNPVRGVALIARASTVEDRLAELSAVVDVGTTREIWEFASSAPEWKSAPLWLHGDLHPANVLIRNGTLASVIDFGDICAGDPATDLAGALMLLPLSAYEAFANAYGGIETDMSARTLGWAVLFALMMISIGLDRRLESGHPSYEAVGRSTLERARLLFEARA